MLAKPNLFVTVEGRSRRRRRGRPMSQLGPVHEVRLLVKRAGKAKIFR